MPSQKDLIGNHPTLPNIFAKWLVCNDVPVSTNKSHRSLTPQIETTNDELIDWLGRKLFEHHHNDYRIEKLKENYKTLGFSKYAEQHRKLPTADKTRKGNATEILLTEYIESCLEKKLIKVFKLKYNPNVEQAMKGDDTLMVEIVPNGNNHKVRLYLGEAKFRKTPSKGIIETLASSLAKEKLPLSYSFLVDELGREATTRNLADILDLFIVEQIKNRGDLVYSGLLISNTNTSANVERHLNSNNPNLVVISIGIPKPEDLINKAFEKAEYFVLNPHEI